MDSILSYILILYIIISILIFSSSMAKAILVSTLQSQFGDFLLGFNGENLNLGIWSGKVELENLQVNPQTIKEKVNK